MGDGRANRRPAILEDQHVVDVGGGTEGGGALGPEVDHLPGAAHTEGGKRRVVVGGVEHDFAATRSEGWPAIRERLHPVRLRRLETANAEGATGRRKGRPFETAAVDEHPGAEERVAPQLRQLRHLRPLRR